MAKGFRKILKEMLKQIGLHKDIIKLLLPLRGSAWKLILDSCVYVLGPGVLEIRRKVTSGHVITPEIVADALRSTGGIDLPPPGSLSPYVLDSSQSNLEESSSSSSSESNSSDSTVPFINESDTDTTLRYGFPFDGSSGDDVQSDPSVPEDLLQAPDMIDPEHVDVPPESPDCIVISSSPEPEEASPFIKSEDGSFLLKRDQVITPKLLSKMLSLPTMQPKVKVEKVPSKRKLESPHESEEDSPPPSHVGKGKGKGKRSKD